MPSNELVPHDDDIVLGSDSVTVTESEPELTLQATIVAAHDVSKSLDNVIIHAARMDKEAAFFALKGYLEKRSAHARVRLIFRSYMDNVKPKFTRERDKFVFQYTDAEGNGIDTYYVTLIRLI